jgi:hypothetical protein
VLDPNACPGLTVNGNSVVFLTDPTGASSGGASYTNSTCSTGPKKALYVGGTAELHGSAHYVGGTYTGDAGNYFPFPPITGAPALIDPWGPTGDDWQQPPTPLDLTNCYGGSYHLTGPGPTSIQRFTPEWPDPTKPLVFCDELEVQHTLSLENGTSCAWPCGVYVFLKGLSVKGQGQILDGGAPLGRGVLLYSTCVPTPPASTCVPGDMVFQGSHPNSLHGLSSTGASHGKFHDMVIWVNKDRPGSTVQLQGGPSLTVEGRLYAGGATLRIGGSPGLSATLNITFIVNTVEFYGGGTFTIPWNIDTAPKFISVVLTQ